MFRSRVSLLAEILFLRHQINIQRRHLPQRQTFNLLDRLIFTGLHRLAPKVLHALAILKPETVIKWHRAERLIGSIRRECVDHIVVFGERHLRHVLQLYMNYYNETRTHLSLNKDAPSSRAAEAVGRIICRPILGGLHHQYARSASEYIQ